MAQSREELIDSRNCASVEAARQRARAVEAESKLAVALAACEAALAWFRAEADMIRTEDGIDPDWLDGPMDILTQAIARARGA